MKKNYYYQKSVLCALTAIMFLLVADYHIMCGIMAVTCLGCAAMFSHEHDLEKKQLIELRSNADEDRPE